MSKYAIFTMDVEALCDTECLKNKGLESYNQMFDGINNYLNLLKQYDIKANLFVVANIVDQIEDILKKAVNNGHKISIHGLSHTAPLLLSNKQFEEDITIAKHKLETLFNIEVFGHRSPCFSIDDDKIEVLNKIGIKYDSSFLNNRLTYYYGKVDITKFNSIKKGLYRKDNFYEFAIPKSDNFPVGGGGYVRLFPWSFVKSKIKKYIKNNEIYIFYLHPFEVSDVKMPKVKHLKSYDRFYLHHNTGSKYIERIDKIINMLKENDYKFVTFEDIIKEIENG